MHLSFTAVDYALCLAMMMLSALIGLYYGCYKKQDSVSEYLLGSKQMGVLPMAMSLVSSYISGITMLGVPSDVYMFGTQFLLGPVMIFPAIFVVQYWFLPMFYNLQYTSVFEYLEHRFSRGVRQVSSFLNAIGQILFLPVVIYVPCLAINQASGLGIHVISPIACAVCILYTSLGGLKAVVWTDTLQLAILTLASSLIVILGVAHVGGLNAAWSRASEGGRLVLFDMDPSPYARCTFVNVALGTFFHHLANHGVGASSVQRNLCVRSLRASRRSLLYLACGFLFVSALNVSVGLIMYATYYHCDPVAAGAVSKPDQLVLHYVMEVAKDWPGLAGLFVAGVLSAAFSSMSTQLNTLSGTLYKDFIENLFPAKVTDKQAATHMKLLSVVIGAFCVVMILVVEHLGAVLQLTISIQGVTGGAGLGVFVLGMFFPWANYKGALWGSIGSLVFTAVMVGGNFYVQATGQLYYPTLPTQTDGCAANNTSGARLGVLTATTSATMTSTAGPPPLRMPHDADVFPLFKISYFYFVMVGTVVTVVIGMAVSLCTEPLPLKDLDPDLLSPAVSRYLPRYRAVRSAQSEDELTEAPIIEL